MATDKVIYVAGEQVAPEVLSSDVLTNAHYNYLQALDWGTAQAKRFFIDRPLRDGRIRFGKQYPGRVINMELGARVNTGVVAAANIERVRDAVWQDWMDKLNPDQGVVTLRQTRLDESGSSVDRVISAEPIALPAWKWSPDGGDYGFHGTHEQPHLVLPVAFDCYFPWFQDATATTDGPNTLDGTLRTRSLSNPGVTSCGLQITIAGSGSNVTVSVDVTSGDDAVVGKGIVLSGVTLGSNIVVDWYSSDPTAWSVLQGTTDVRGNLGAGNGIFLARGSNTVSFQVTSGSLTSGQITFSWVPLWAAM